jgi:hypothetical protein
MADILTSSSLLLAIITAIYTLYYPSIIEIIAILPEKHSADNETNYIKAKNIRNTKLLPLLISSIMLTLTFIPEFIKQVSSSARIILDKGFLLSTYDIVVASFIIVCLFMFLFCINVCVLSFKLINTIRKLKG